MKLTGNTVLITGGGSGIGRGLAQAFHAAGNQVVIAGRRENRLAQTATENPGMEYLVFDQETSEGVQKLAEAVRERFPALNVLINNAGIQHVEDLTKGSIAETESTMQINLLGPMRLTAALLPQLLSQPEGAIVNVTSTLAFVPAAMMPSYCASKAAMHSYTQSLRFQLRKSALQVIEIVPPWLQTELQGSRGMNPKAMPLDKYLKETMAILKNAPESTEILVDLAKPTRYVEHSDYDAFYSRYNLGWLAAQGLE